MAAGQLADPQSGAKAKLAPDRLLPSSHLAAFVAVVVAHSSLALSQSRHAAKAASRHLNRRHLKKSSAWPIAGDASPIDTVASGRLAQLGPRRPTGGRQATRPLSCSSVARFALLALARPRASRILHADRDDFFLNIHENRHGRDLSGVGLGR